MTAASDREARTQQIGREILAAVTAEGTLRSASSLLSGRAVQRRLLTRAVEDPALPDPALPLRRRLPQPARLRRPGPAPARLSPIAESRLLLSTGCWLGHRPAPPHLGRRPSDRARHAAHGQGTHRRTRRHRSAPHSEPPPPAHRLHPRHPGRGLPERDRGPGVHPALRGPPRLAAARGRPLVERPVTRPFAGGEIPRVNLSLKISSLLLADRPARLRGLARALVAGLKPLFAKARHAGVFLNLDLERFAYRDLTYAVFADLALDDDLRDYPHLGVVVQAYLRDSEDDVQILVDLAQRRGTPFTVRLVKGAYWDYETVIAAQEHWASPVFATKAETDAQFERLAKVLVDNWEWTRPALGTHNIRSMAAGIATAEAAGLPPGAVELQMLHGMAESIRRAAVALGYRVREYVPVGELDSRHGLPGAPPAGEHRQRILPAPHLRPAAGPDELLAAPGTSRESDRRRAAGALQRGSPTAAAPAGPRRRPRREAATPLERRHPGGTPPPRRHRRSETSPTPTSPGRQTRRDGKGPGHHPRKPGARVRCHRRRRSRAPPPSCRSTQPDRTRSSAGWPAPPEQADRALEAARAAFPGWRDTPARERAAALLRAAALMREQRFELAALEVVEAGKPWREADADVTEAIDFLEYYGREMLRLSRREEPERRPRRGRPLLLRAPRSGRGHRPLELPPRHPHRHGVGRPRRRQHSGLQAGQATPVIGYALVRILHEAGVPVGAVNFLPGPGSEVGDHLVADPRVDLIAFTGSLDVGLSIMQKAATVAPGQRNIKKVIAELGGKNAIIVDTDADLDAAVEGVIVSAFHYAGQKCSACSRVIVLEEVYEPFVRRLTQAAASLKVGDPADPGTRVGPIITAEARDRILSYIKQGTAEARLAYPPADSPSIPPVRRPAAGSGELTDEAARTATPATAGADERRDDAAAAVDGWPGPRAGDCRADARPGRKPPLHPRQPGYFVLPHVFVDVPREASSPRRRSSVRCLQS